MRRSSDSDELVDMNAVDSSKKRVEYDKRIKTSARDMRIREDIAYYLKNLDDDSADRRDYSSDGIGKNADGTQKLRADQVLDTGDMSDFRQAQLFAWEAHTKGVNIHLESQPTATGRSAEAVRRSAAAEAGRGAQAAAGGDAAQEAGDALRRVAAAAGECAERRGVGRVRGVRPQWEGGEGNAGRGCCPGR